MFGLRVQDHFSFKHKYLARFFLSSVLGGGGGVVLFFFFK